MASLPSINLVSAIVVVCAASPFIMQSWLAFVTPAMVTFVWTIALTSLALMTGLSFVRTISAHFCVYRLIELATLLAIPPDESQAFVQ